MAASSFRRLNISRRRDHQLSELKPPNKLIHSIGCFQPRHQIDSHLTLRQSCKRFARLGNGFSKRLENHCAAVSLYVAHYNLCRVHESLRSTPSLALGITDKVWAIADLLGAAISTQPIEPVTTAPDRRKRLKVIEGGQN